MLIVAQMLEEHNDELFFQKLATLLNTVKTCMYDNHFPIYDLTL